MASQIKKRKVETAAVAVDVAIASSSTTITDDTATPSTSESTESDTSEVTILDLNDDCLREICDYLDLMNLCAFADVCSRFKQNAQAKFRGMDVKDVDKHTWTELPDIAKYRLVRNFGQSITSLAAVALKRNNEYIVLMIIRYCGNALKSLTLQNFRINAYLGERLMSLVSLLDKFGITECHCQPSFCERLPMHSQKLRELEFKFESYSQYSNVFVLGGLPKPFPKLDKFTMVDWEARDLRPFLEKNQQLSSINLESVNGNEDHFQLVAKHLPTVEHMGIVISKSWRLDGHKNLNKLMALKSLRLKCHRPNYDATIRELLAKMAAVNIPIETLELMTCPSNKALFAVIPKFEKLKTLRLFDMTGLQFTELITLCNDLDELTELCVRTDQNDFMPDILRLVRSAKKLQKFHFQQRNGNWTMSADTFDKLVHTMKHRTNGCTQLDIVLMGIFPAVDVGDDVLQANKQFVTIETNKVWEDIDFGFISQSAQQDSDSEFDYDMFRVQTQPSQFRTRMRQYARARVISMITIDD